jgi:phosphinothricin acetyltransferase
MKIRSATVDDAEAIAAIYAPIVLETTISLEWVPPTADAFRERIAKTLLKYPWLVAVDDDDAVAAYVYAGAHRDPPSYQWSINTSVFIRADCRGMGVGRSLYEELHRQLAALGYYRAFAGVALPNDASVALHRAVGYRQLGVYEKVGFKFGAWRDVAWFSKVLRVPGDHPEPPTHP